MATNKGQAAIESLLIAPLMLLAITGVLLLSYTGLLRAVCAYQLNAALLCVQRHNNAVHNCKSTAEQALKKVLLCHENLHVDFNYNLNSIQAHLQITARQPCVSIELQGQVAQDLQGVR